MLRSIASRNSSAPTSVVTKCVAATNWVCGPIATVVSAVAGAGASTIGWQQEFSAAMPFFGDALCFAVQQAFAWQQLRAAVAERFLQQLQPQQVVAPEALLIARQVPARQSASRCPSAQIQAVWGSVPRKNAGSITSERILSRYDLAKLFILRSIAKT